MLPSNKNYALKLEHAYLNIPEEIFEQLNKNQQWEVKQRFLDEAIAKGKPFMFSPSSLKDSGEGLFKRKVEHLKGKGYVLNVDGTTMLPPGVAG